MSPKERKSVASPIWPRTKFGSSSVAWRWQAAASPKRPRSRSTLPKFAWWSARGGASSTARRKAASAFSSCPAPRKRSEEHTSELQSLRHLVCRLLLEKKKKKKLADPNIIKKKQKEEKKI